MKHIKIITPKFYEYPYIGINAAFAHYLEGDKERAKDILDDVDKDQLKDLKEYYQSVKERIL